MAYCGNCPSCHGHPNSICPTSNEATALRLAIAQRAQDRMTRRLGQVACGHGNRHGEHALTSGACLKCGAAL